MLDLFNYCEDAYFYWPGRSDSSSSSRTAGLFLFTLGCLQFIALLAIALYLFREWRKARSPLSFLYNEAAFQDTLVFPLYFKILAICGLAACWNGIVNLVFPVGFLSDNPLSTSLIYGSSWGFYHCVIEGIAFLMCSDGVGTKAATRATLFGLLFGILTFLTAGFSFYMVNTLSGAIAMSLLNGIELVFYSCLWLLPAKALFRRPAIYEFARFWAINKALLISSSWLIYFNIGAGYCLNELSTTGILSPVIPYVCYRCLLRDAKYWQGLLALESTMAAEIRKPLLGTSLDPSSARAIASRIDSTSFTSGRQSNGGGAVRILNFAFLKIDQLAPEYSSNRNSHAVIGAGSSSRVFRGTYKGRKVAIKMIFCPELTAETISTFYHEATLLASLVHPNVVEIIGVCVLPPSICLVMELCDGNLYEYLRTDSGKLNIEAKLNLVQDMSAAVSYLHTRDTPVLHLDIKSSNFLIVKGDNDRIHCKVADLEWSREIVVAETEIPKKASRPNSVPASPAVSAIEAPVDVLENAVTIAKSLTDDSARTSDTVAHLLSGSQLSGFKVPETIYWLAPELMMGRAYSEKADVYSLSMVIWELFTGKVPYKDIEEQLMNQMQANIRAAMIGKHSPSVHSFGQPNSSLSSNASDGLLVGSRRSDNEIRTSSHNASNPPSAASSLSSQPLPELAQANQTALALVTQSNQFESSSTGHRSSDSVDLRVESLKTPQLTALTTPSLPSQLSSLDGIPQLPLQPAVSQSVTVGAQSTVKRGSGSGTSSPARRRHSDASLHVPRLHKLDPKDIRVSELQAQDKKSRKNRKRNSDYRRGSSTGNSPPESQRSSASTASGATASPAIIGLSNTSFPSFSSYVFVSKQQVQQALQHLICARNYRPALPDTMPTKLKQLLTRGWAANPRDRPSAAEFVKVCDEIRLDLGLPR